MEQEGKKQHGDGAAAGAVEAVVKTDGHAGDQGHEDVPGGQRLLFGRVAPGIFHKDHQNGGQGQQYHEHGPDLGVRQVKNDPRSQKGAEERGYGADGSDLHIM